MLSKIQRYIWNNLIAIDQLANALLGGDPDETISSRIGKKIHQKGVKSGPIKWLGDFLDWIDKDHTLKSIEEDEGQDEVIK